MPGLAYVPVSDSEAPILIGAWARAGRAPASTVPSASDTAVSVHAFIVIDRLLEIASERRWSAGNRPHLYRLARGLSRHTGLAPRERRVPVWVATDTMATTARFDVLIHAPFYAALRALAPGRARGASGASSIG